MQRRAGDEHTGTGGVAHAQRGHRSAAEQALAVPAQRPQPVGIDQSLQVTRVQGGQPGRAHVGRRDRDPATLVVQKRRTQHGKNVGTRARRGVQRPDGPQLPEERADREALGVHRDEGLAVFERLVVALERDRRLAGRRLGPEVGHRIGAESGEDVLGQLRRPRAPVVERDRLALGADKQRHRVDPVVGHLGVAAVAVEVGVEGALQVAPLADRVVAGEEQLLVAPADPALGLGPVAIGHGVVVREFPVEAEFGGGVCPVHQDLGVLAPHDQRVDLVAERGIRDELHLLVAQALFSVCSTAPTVDGSFGAA